MTKYAVYYKKIENYGYPYYKRAATKNLKSDAIHGETAIFEVTDEELAEYTVECTRHGKLNKESFAFKIAAHSKQISGRPLGDPNAPKVWE